MPTMNNTRSLRSVHMDRGHSGVIDDVIRAKLRGIHITQDSGMVLALYSAHPSIIINYRHWDSPGEDDMLRALQDRTPYEAAEIYWEHTIPHVAEMISLGIAHDWITEHVYFQPINEPVLDKNDPLHLTKAELMNEYFYWLVMLGLEYGLRVSLFGFSVGSPDINIPSAEEIEAGYEKWLLSRSPADALAWKEDQLRRVDFWYYLTDALKVANDHESILCLHEYMGVNPSQWGWGNQDAAYANNTVKLLPDAYSDHCWLFGRFRQVEALWLAKDDQEYLNRLGVSSDVKAQKLAKIRIMIAEGGFDICGGSAAAQAWLGRSPSSWANIIPYLRPKLIAAYPDRGYEQMTDSQLMSRAVDRWVDEQLQYNRDRVIAYCTFVFSSYGWGDFDRSREDLRADYFNDIMEFNKLKA